ncbi:MAG TPA: hypothetical protein VLN26_03555, partial [Gaiellaceae bacterium]|nr:hypothetical protein [Gaiellaceae bacterium]
MLVRLPQPYDFALSTERFRAFGADRANLWHEGGLHRVVSGREVRIEAARCCSDAPAEPAHRAAGAPSSLRPCGVEVAPLDAETEPVVRRLLGAPFELGPFYAFAAGEPVLAELVTRLAGFRPPLAPDPFEALVTSICAQQVSLFSAFAIRNRFVERYGEPGRL